MPDFEKIVDRIYEASTEPDLWSAALHDLGEAVGAPAVGMITRRNDNWIGWRYSPNTPPGIDAYLSSEAAARSHAPVRLIAANHAGFISDTDLFSEEEYLSDPLMTEWAGPNGLHHAAATAIQVPTGDFILIQATRRKGQQPFSANDVAYLDTFRPHLARAGLLATRWRLAQFRAAAVALAQIGLPAAVLDIKGSVLATNELIAGMSSCLSWLPKDRVALTDASADPLLQRAIATLQDVAAPVARSIPMRIRDTGEVVIIHLIPATGRAREFFGGGFGILVVTKISSPSPVDVGLLHGLFDLTPSEARVANGIVQGLSLDQIAARHNVTHETVRSHAKVVYAKTGTSGQSQVSALLAKLPKMPLR